MTSLVLWVMEVISLWHCWDVKKTQIALILGFNFFALLVLVFHLRLDNTLEIVGDVQNRSVYWSKSSTEMPLSLEELLIFLAVWADVESCWNFKLTNVKTFLVGDFQHSTFTKTSRFTWLPKLSLPVWTSLGTSRNINFLAFPLLLQTLWP